MTIFDSIRYPLNDKPTGQQIEALPKDLKYILFKCVETNFSDPADRYYGMDIRMTTGDLWLYLSGSYSKEHEVLALRAVTAARKQILEKE